MYVHVHVLTSLLLVSLSEVLDSDESSSDIYIICIHTIAECSFCFVALSSNISVHTMYVYILTRDSSSGIVSAVVD